ncbi:MAG: MraY family glycosyltransferase [Putridiphycobacter sp.]|nr:MraY family glycosyltransferase [Putridiphycobacter sp.]
MEIITLKYTLVIGFFAATYTLGNSMLPRLIKYFKKNAMMDKPNWRSAHTVPTPSSGGMSFIFSLFVMLPFVSESNQLLGGVIACFIAGSLGFFDDRYALKPGLKFVVQFIVASILFLASLKIDNLTGMFGLYAIHPILSYSITIFFVVAIMNAFNLIDGIDGLAAGIAMIASLTFGVIFLWHSDFLFSLLAFAFAGSLGAFLKFNFNPAKIFMGDTGSLAIGVLLAVFFMRTFSHHNLSTSAVGFSVLLFPLTDMARLFIVRIINRKSPFSADKNHYHHLLIKSGDSHKKAAISGYIITIVHIVIGLIFSSICQITAVFIIISVMSTLMYVFVYLKYFQNARKNSKIIVESINTSTKSNYLLVQHYEK